MAEIHSSSFVHLYGSPNVRVKLCEDRKGCCVSVSSGLSDVHVYVDVKQAEQLYDAFGLAWRMLLDVERPDSAPICGDDDCCDLGSAPVPYSQPS